MSESMLVNHSRDHRENVYGCNECPWQFNTVAGLIKHCQDPPTTDILLAQLVGKSLQATPTCVSIPSPTMLKFVISAIEFLFQMINCLII